MPFMSPSMIIGPGVDYFVVSPIVSAPHWTHTEPACGSASASDPRTTADPPRPPRLGHHQVRAPPTAPSPTAAAPRPPPPRRRPPPAKPTGRYYDVSLWSEGEEEEPEEDDAGGSSAGLSDGDPRSAR